MLTPYIRQTLAGGTPPERHWGATDPPPMRLSFWPPLPEFSALVGKKASLPGKTKESLFLWSILTFIIKITFLIQPGVSFPPNSVIPVQAGIHSTALRLRLSLSGQPRGLTPPYTNAAIPSNQTLLFYNFNQILHKH